MEQPPNQPNAGETWLDRVKRHPLIVLVSAIAAVVVGVATLTGAVERINSYFTPSPPRHQTKYVDLSGQAIALLLQGKLDSSLGEAIDAKPMVWKNEVYNEALRLHRMYAETVEAGSDMVLVRNADEGYTEIDSPTQLVWDFDEGAIFPEGQMDDQEADEASSTDGQSTIDSRSWKVSFLADQPMGDITAAIQAGELSADSLIFSRKVSCTEFATRLKQSGNYENTMLARYLNDGCTNMAFDEIATHIDDGCGGVSYWSTNVAVPRVVLSVVAIKNISQSPIRVELDYSHGRLNGIAPRDHATLADQSAKVGDGTILPGEALIVPLGLSLANQPVEDFAMHGNSDDSVYAREALSKGLLNAISAAKTIPLRIQYFDSSFAQPDGYSITANRLLNDYGFTPTEEPQPMASFGPVIELKTIRVNGRKQNVHKATASETYVTSQATVGSCPHLYATTVDLSNLYMGTVLVGRDAQHKRGIDYRRIDSWPRTVTVSERDPETTHLHGVWAVCENPDATQIRIAGRRPSQDGELSILKRHDTATFEFEPLPSGAQCSSYFVATDGFYVLDQPTSARLSAGGQRMRGDPHKTSDHQLNHINRNVTERR